LEKTYGIARGVKFYGISPTHWLGVIALSRKTFQTLIEDTLHDNWLSLEL